MNRKQRCDRDDGESGVRALTKLTILHTNDIHGRVEQLARISTLVKQVRSEVSAAGGYTAFWDAGDVEDPTLFESQVTKGGAALALLRAAGCELVALGNASPVRYGQQVISELASRFGRLLLCANMFDRQLDRLVSGVEPYAIQTFGDLKVGVIGLSAPLSFYTMFNVTMGDPVALLPGLIREVRERGAQLVVLLSHLGFDQNPQADYPVAEAVPGIGVIIGGHTHTELSRPVVTNGTVIVQTGDFGRYLGRLDLEIDVSGNITRHSGQLIRVTEDVPLDPGVMNAYADEQASVRQALTRVIGELRSPADWSPERQCAAGNLFADALRERWKGAEIALTLAGHWRAGLDAGPLTLGALIDALRSSANPARATLTGTQVLAFLRQALAPENAARKLRPLRGVPVGMPHVAGMTARYDSVSGEITGAFVGREPLHPERNYVVAATDLEFSDFIGYLNIPDDEIEYEVPTIMPEVIEEYIARHSPLPAVHGHRLEVM